MANLQQTEHHQRIYHLYSSFNLKRCNFVDLKENALTHSFQNRYSKDTKPPPQEAPYGEIRMSHLERNLGRGAFPASPKVWTFHFSSIPLPSPTKKLKRSLPDQRPYIWRKILLIALRQILPKILPVARILSFKNMKKLAGTKCHNTKHCSAGLSPRIIPPVFPFLLKVYSFPPPEKSLFINLHPPLSKVSFLTHKIAIFM